MKSVVIIICFVIFSITYVTAQKIPVGGGIIYNFANGWGLDARMEYPVTRLHIPWLRNVIAVPQLNYYPSLNKRHELHIVLSGHYNFYSFEGWNIYALGNMSYIAWLDHGSSDEENAKFSNIGADVGAGITYTGCWQPFTELRLNVIGIEPSFRIGLKYLLKCKQRGMVPCPNLPIPDGNPF